jgi:hypothetical protein
MPGRPRVPTHDPLRVVLPSPSTPAHPSAAHPPRTPPPSPAGSTLPSPSPDQAPFHATPRHLDFAGTPSPRVGSAPQQPSPSPPPPLPAREPVAHRTRARVPAPAPLALFTAGRPLHECVSYHMPTAKAIRPPAEPLGFAGLCRSMPAREVMGFAGLCQALSRLDVPAALSVLDPSTGEFLEHRQLRPDPRYKATWDRSYANELGCLCQRIGSGTTPTSKRVAGADTFFLIDYHDIPAHKQKEICHTMVVCEVRPDKDDPNCTRITIGGSRICFPGDVGTNTASLELFNLLLNSVLSRKGARFSTIDLKNFYLDTPMPEPEYVRIKLSDIPVEFIEEYKLAGTDRDSWIYFEICPGCYGLPQAGILANISSDPACSLKAIMKWNPPLASGATNGVLSNSASSWMTLEWNTLELNTSTTSWTFSRNSMGSNSTWPATNLRVSISSVTTQIDVVASVCQDTSTPCSLSLNIPVLPSNASPCTSVCQSPMALRPSSLQKLIPQSYLTNTENAASRKSLVPSSTMPEQ